MVLFSGGEPLVRKDLPELAAYAVSKGMRAVISTNGTLITRGDRAHAEGHRPVLRRHQPGRDAGASTTGSGRCRGRSTPRSNGIRNCQAAGIKVGLRFTINRYNVAEIPSIFELLEDMDIPRVCFYHLVYAGRGSELVNQDLDRDETRRTVDLIIDHTRRLHATGKPKEVLTVDNHADGPYVYLRMLQEDPARAREVLELLQWNEGNSSGRGIGCVSWDGEVHADQFWRHHSFGNVTRRPFSEIWEDTLEPAHGGAQGEEKAREGPLRRLPLAGRLRRELPCARRGGQRRCVGPGPGLLPDRRGNRAHAHPGRLPVIVLRFKRSVLSGP